MTDPFSMIQAHAEEQRSQALMHIQNRQNMIHEFLDKLSNEDLGLVGTYTTDLALGAAHEGTYWQGVIEQKLRARGVCQHCGHDHTEALLGDDHQPIEDAKRDPEYIEVDIPDDGGEVTWTQPTLDEAMNPLEIFEAVMTEDAAEENIRANAVTWGVFFKDPQNLQGPVICGACGTESVSLEDRMLRWAGVKGCGGCQQKAKWG